MSTFTSLVELNRLEGYLIEQGFVIQLNKDQKPIYILNCGQGNLILVDIITREISFSSPRYTSHALVYKIRNGYRHKYEDEFNNAFNEFERNKEFRIAFGLEVEPHLIEVW